MLNTSHLFVFLTGVVLVSQGASPPSNSTEQLAGGCKCSNRNLDYKTALGDQDKDSLCKFGSMIQECLNACDPEIADMLSVALMKNPCVSCGAVRLLTSLLCVLLPTLHVLL